MAGHIGSPHTAEEFEHFYRVEKKLGGLLINKETMTFLGKKYLASSCWALLLQDMRAPPSGLPILFLVSVY